MRMTDRRTNDRKSLSRVMASEPEGSAVLLRELVAHLRQNRSQLRQEWAKRISEARLLTAMTQDEVVAEATSVYDNYVETLETGTYQALQAYARNLSERIIPRGVETEEVVGIVLLVRISRKLGIPSEAIQPSVAHYRENSNMSTPILARISSHGRRNAVANRSAFR